MKKKLLVIDDDSVINHLICKRISGPEIEAKGVLKGEKVLTLVGEFEPDLLLLDYQLNGMTGRDVIRDLCANGHSVPFIVISGNGDERIAVEMMKAGAMDYLVKDSEFFSILPTKVRQVLNHIETAEKLKESEARLAESEAKSKRIIDSMKDPVFICDSDRVVIYENAGMMEYTGETAIGKKCHQVIFGKETPCEGCRNMCAEEDSFDSFEMIDEVRNRTLMISSGPIKFHNNSISRLNILRDISELSKIREEAAKSERKFRFIAENAVDVIWQMDRRLSFTYVSPAAEKLLGYPPEEIMGRTLRDFTTRNAFFSMARVALKARNIKESGFVSTLETEMVHKDGSVVPVEISGKLLIGEKGQFVGVQGATRDISERIRAREAIEDQHHLLQTLIDNIPDQIYVKDRESKYLLNNRGHRKEIGADEMTDITGRSDSDFFDPELAGVFREDEKRIMDSGQPMLNKEEYRQIRNSPGRWSLTTKIPLKNSSGEIIGIAGVNRDITERKIQEEELLRSRYELAFINKISKLFLVSDAFEIFDKLLELITGELYSDFGFIGIIDNSGMLKCTAVLDRSADSECPENPGIARTDWNGSWGMALTLLSTMNSAHQERIEPFNLTVNKLLSVPIVLADKLIGILAVGERSGTFKEADVKLVEHICDYLAPIIDAKLKEYNMRLERERAFADLKAAKEKAEESDNLKSAFLLNLSHELRTPLNSIIGFSNLLTRHLEATDDNRKYAEMINAAGHDLIKMVSDTIEISKLESKDYTVEPDKVDIIAMLRELHAEHSGYFSQQYPDLEFRFTPGMDELYIFTDEAILKTALSKIIDNAGKFTISGRVEMGIIKPEDSDDEALEIYVNDNGIGIPKELHETVFRKFWKIMSKKVLYRGNGLGLSIARGMIELIGGQIMLDSEEGKGTTVYIRLMSGPEGRDSAALKFEEAERQK